MLTHDAKCGMIVVAWTYLLWGCGCSGGGSPSAYLLTKLRLVDIVGQAIIPPERRKEAISWKTPFLAVANVVKVIWFRFRFSVARELQSSTRPGFALTLLGCTTLNSVLATLSLINPFVTDHSIRIGVTVHRGLESHSVHGIEQMSK